MFFLLQGTLKFDSIIALLTCNCTEESAQENVVISVVLFTRGKQSQYLSMTLCRAVYVFSAQEVESKVG